MRVLVLGSTGMLGHKMVERLRPVFKDVIGVSRPAFDATNLDSVRKILDFFHPDVVVNCVGLIKQREQNPELSLAINGDLPHFLQSLCADRGAYLVHFSTDCVFSGSRGNYTEDDYPDPKDLYGESKKIGEVYADNALTIRTSIVGRERNNFRGLLEWFLHQKGDISGYTNAIFSGVATSWLSETVGNLIQRKDRLTGLYQIAAAPISKFSLLKTFQELYNKYDVNIVPVETPVINRSLSPQRFVDKTRITIPPLEEQLYWQKKSDGEMSDYVI